MHQAIAQYLQNCDIWTRIKHTYHAPYGLLKPLRVPFRKWLSISLDLITELSISQGFDALLVVVDHLSKIVHYISTTTDINSKGIAHLFLDNMFHLHSLSDSIVSDCRT